MFIVRYLLFWCSFSLLSFDGCCLSLFVVRCVLFVVCWLLFVDVVFAVVCGLLVVRVGCALSSFVAGCSV